MIYVGMVAIVTLIGVFSWNMMVRAAYESAEYQVIESDGKFEGREYPDLMLVATTTKLDAQGRDGSFMRLFRYISQRNGIAVWLSVRLDHTQLAEFQPLPTYYSASLERKFNLFDFWYRNQIRPDGTELCNR